MRRRRKKILTALLATMVAVLTALAGASEYFLHYALHRNTYGLDADKEFERMKTEYPWTAGWIDSIRGQLRDTVITGHDGNRLHAWMLRAPAPTGNTAVIVHGYQSNPIAMMQIAYMYHTQMGWNIMLPHLAAHALSEGEWIQMGWNDRKDVERWTEVAHSVFRADTMVVHGISMGAATTMCVAGDTTPPYVRAFVEDCGYTSVWSEFEGELHKQFALPPFPLLHATSMLSKLQLGWSFGEASPLAQVSRASKPMLFIHGDNDTYVPTAMVYPLFKACTVKKQLWIAPGAEHAEAYRLHHEAYTREVRRFLESALREKR